MWRLALVLLLLVIGCFFCEFYFKKNNIPTPINTDAIDQPVTVEYQKKIELIERELNELKSCCSEHKVNSINPPPIIGNETETVPEGPKLSGY